MSNSSNRVIRPDHWNPKTCAYPARESHRPGWFHAPRPRRRPRERWSIWQTVAFVAAALLLLWAGIVKAVVAVVG